MKIAVVGLWHLGMVTAACLAAEGHDVTAFDAAPIVADIERGKLPVAEPGLAELVAQGQAAGRLRFAAEPSLARGVELVWICFDTPVDDDDSPDVGWVVERIGAFLTEFAQPAVVAISSQLPVGSIARLERRFAALGSTFACIPENLRLGSAIAYFRAPDRFVAGTRDARARDVIERAIGGFAPAIVWTGVESAEMIKHAINAFLATSVVFANELAAICERVGADARDVERGLKSDVRIGPKAYVRAGEAFAGGTLARDLTFLRELGLREGIPLDQVSGTATSNERHRDWAFDRIREVGGGRSLARVALLGLVYKPGTDTLRASNAVSLARRLRQAGVLVTAYDPAIAPGDPRLAGVVDIAASAEAALDGADVAVVATPWPQFRDIEPLHFAQLGERTAIDESRFLEDRLASVDGLRYIAFGRPVRSIVAR
jgi:UDPglucose 6-dehydrogenase